MRSSKTSSISSISFPLDYDAFFQKLREGVLEGYQSHLDLRDVVLTPRLTRSFQLSWFAVEMEFRPIGAIEW